MTNHILPSTCYRSQAVASRSCLTQDMSELASSGVEFDSPICGSTRAAQVDDNLLVGHGIYVRPSPIRIRLSKYDEESGVTKFWTEAISPEVSEEYEQMEVDRLMEATAKGGTYSDAGVTCWRSETSMGDEQQFNDIRAGKTPSRRFNYDAQPKVKVPAIKVEAPKVEAKSTVIVINQVVLHNFCREIEDRGAKFWKGLPKDWNDFVEWTKSFKGGQFVGRLPEIRKTLERRTLDRMTG